MKRLSKTEAVGLLCDIKRDVTRQLKHEKTYMKLNTPSAEQIQYERWIQALEMAGRALTR